MRVLEVVVVERFTEEVTAMLNTTLTAFSRFVSSLQPWWHTIGLCPAMVAHHWSVEC